LRRRVPRLRMYRDRLPGTAYELLPGIGVTASAYEHAPPRRGTHPLVVWSHGRSGTQTAYVMLCEGLAARGYVVAAPAHPGDTLLDWITGTAVDDATNERQRVADVQVVLDHLLGSETDTFDGLPVIDPARVAVAGHSYGAFTAYAFASTESDRPRIRGAAGLQSLTRTIPPDDLGRISVPLLMVTGSFDDVTPPVTDADPAFAAFARHDVHRVDIRDAGHQGCSDVGLYLELIDEVAGVPDLVRDFVTGMAVQVTGQAGTPWRPTVTLHLRILGAWLDKVTDGDPDRAQAELAAVAAMPGVVVRLTDRHAGC
jgi:dienelactone hydrolase